MSIKAKRVRKRKGLENETPGMTKQDMYVLYETYGMLTVRYRMNDIISDNRDISPKLAGYVKVLYDSEALKVMKSFS